MARRLGWFLVLLAMAVPACAAGLPGSISGVVRNSAGVPQMGAAVEIFSLANPQGLTLFTDARGFYRADGLQPGAYQMKATAPSYLPTLREKVALRAGANLIVNLTLSTLFEAIELLPTRRSASQDQDDWKWTLRTVASRPILRVFDEGSLVVTEKGKKRALKAQLAFVAGSENEGFGSSADLSTRFRLEQSLFSSGTLFLGGNVGYGGGPAAGVVRAAYRHEFANGSHPEIALTARHFASPGTAQHNAALDALALSVSDGITLADFLELNYGGEMQTIQFHNRVSAFRPFGSVVVHLSPDTVVQYQYATSEPNTRLAKGFDTAPADLSESGPRMTLAGNRPQLEHARHHEVSVSQRLGNTSLQLAAYSDRILGAALVGVGDVTADSGEFLPDVYSGTFSYNGGDLSTAGFRVVVERKLAPDLTATLDYAYGGVITLAGSGMSWDEAQSLLHTQRRHALAAKMAGRVPHCRTRWIASYKWTSGSALTPVDLFNSSPGEADPYLNVFIRQPIPASSFLPGHMEALLDLRNLLAQGYVPVLGQDGQTLYLVQSARSIRGGLAFTF